MDRILMIEPDRGSAQALGLACLARDVGVAIAENLCDGVRTLLTTSVSLIVADAGALKLAPREVATFLGRIAPDVPVVVAVRAEAALDQRVAFELAGFRVLTRPLTVDDLVDKIAALEMRD